MLDVPDHLRGSNYRGASEQGFGVDYQYPHDAPGGWVAQQYLPDELTDRTYYRPTSHGAEAAWGDIAARLRAMRRDDPAGDSR